MSPFWLVHWNAIPLNKPVLFFFAFIPLSLLAYIKELIISGHFALLYFVLHQGLDHQGHHEHVQVCACCVWSQYPSFFVSVWHVRLCSHVCACATYVRCNIVRKPSRFTAVSSDVYVMLLPITHGEHPGTLTRLGWNMRTIMEIWDCIIMISLLLHH